MNFQEQGHPWSRSPTRALRRRRARRIAGAVAASVFVAASSAAQPAPPAPISPPPQSASAAVQGEAAWAQLAAYEQYLLYLSLVSSQPNAPKPDLSQYLNNGAAVTTVPSAGKPGSAYFSNGAGVTSVPSPGQPGSDYFTNGAEVTKVPWNTGSPTLPPPPAPSASAPTPWWLPEAPASSPAAESSAAPAQSAETNAVEGAPMSFEAWLRAMRASVPGGSEETQALATEEKATPPVSEPTAVAYDERRRETYPPPEKPAEHATRASTKLGIFVAGAFALGLLLGALATRRARPRASTR